MKNRAYKTSIKREILSSKARFISIMAIIFLGVAFYTGIKSAGPDMTTSINEFFSRQNLMDSKIVSSLGLNENDLKLLENNDKILDYDAVKSIDVNLTNTNNVAKFIAYNKNKSNSLNKFVVVEGRLPENSGEIALDKNILKENSHLKIGDTFVVKSDKNTEKKLKKKTFKIVGFVNSPMHIDYLSRGTTTVGKGSIDYFAVINDKDISMDVYTEIYVRFKNVAGLGAYSKEYENKMEENKKYLEKLYSKRALERIEEVKLDAQRELNKAYKKIEKNENKLDNAQLKIDRGKEQLLDGQKEYEQGLKKYKREIKSGKSQLISAQNQLYNGQKQLDEEKEKLKDGQKQLDSAKSKLNSAKDKLLNQGIDPTKSTKEYENQINGLSKLISTYDLLSKDINPTVNNIAENKQIPSEKIKYWKSIISNMNVNEFNILINNLEKDPTNKSLALTLAKSIDSARKDANENQDKLKTLVAGIKEYQQGVTTYDKEVNIFNEGKKQLELAQIKIDKNKEELQQAKREFEEGKISGKEKLDKSKEELESSKQKLVDAQDEIDKNKQKLIDARVKVDKESKKLNDLDKSKYYFFDRDDNSGYSTYRGSVESLDKIASVFPVFFFVVAALICLTTMTRMVEENRIEIGTLKALGYRDFEIAQKFIVYAAIATLAGCVVGILVGSNILPYVINKAYSDTFILPPVKIKYYPSYIIQSLVGSVLCTVGAALIVLKEELRETPANLMRAKAPKLGKKILLERITPLWKRLNFNQKVTCRNLFRYKQRMLMTIIGISGCMAMLVTGMALQKSNDSIMDIQFKKLIKHDAMVVFNDDFTKKDEKEYEKSLSNLKGFESSLNIYQESVTFSKKGMSKQSAQMYVPENVHELNDYILLNDRTSGNKYTLSNNGAVISEKLAKLLGVSIGDEVVLTDADNNNHNVKIDNIVENYAGHYIYLSPKYYKKVFSNNPKYNAQLIILNSNREDDNTISKNLMDNKKVVNVTLTSKIRSLSESADLGLVMLVIIAASGSLAFVVLYNLININVSERIREISTIKVLGFYDNEVAMYIFRENIILTIMGIFTGSIMGNFLYKFITSTAETDNMMMIPEVYMSSYVISGLITMLFAVLVMIMMYIKLKKINMIDALKSVE
ncbi:FtsX-like permease family protein [Terrisporobacter sp.]